MKWFGIFFLGIGLFIVGCIMGYQTGGYHLEARATSMVKQDMRDAFNLGYIERKNEEGLRESFWPRNATIPQGVQRNFSQSENDIRIRMGTYADQVILYCRPIYGRDAVVVLYDNGTVGEMSVLPPPFSEK
ncbi:MAG: hypothetical protein ACSHX4_03325 [Opitutaceae bacterium]